MTIVKTHDVFCDRCPNWAQDASKTDEQGGTGEARKAARKAGWARRSGEDLCPECRQRDDARKRAVRSSSFANVATKTALAITIGALALAAPASAHRRPFLSTARAERSIVRAARADLPRSVQIGRCRRHARRTVRCWVTERDAMNILTDNDIPVATDMTCWETVTLKRGHVKVTLF